jgi:hypothetical protein
MRWITLMLRYEKIVMNRIILNNHQCLEDYFDEHISTYICFLHCFLFHVQASARDTHTHTHTHTHSESKPGELLPSKCVAMTFDAPSPPPPPPLPPQISQTFRLPDVLRLWDRCQSVCLNPKP